MAKYLIFIIVLILSYIGISSFISIYLIEEIGMMFIFMLLGCAIIPEIVIYSLENEILDNFKKFK